MKAVISAMVSHFRMRMIFAATAKGRGSEMSDRETLVQMIVRAVNGTSTYWAGLITDYLIEHNVSLPKYGSWENANRRPKTYIRRCSHCGGEAYFCGIGCSYKFCPNSGAKMDLEG